MKYSDIDLSNPCWAELCYKYVEQEEVYEDFYIASCEEDLSIVEYCLKNKRDVIDFGLENGLILGSVEF